MDPISIGIASYKATVTVGGFLLYRDSVLTIVNESRYDLSVAICLGNSGNSFAFGWHNISRGHTFGTEFPVLRTGQDLVIYAEADNGRYTWSGETYFYALHPQAFGIRNARLTSAQLVSGNGQMTTVPGRLMRMAGDFTYRLQ